MSDMEWMQEAACLGVLHEMWDEHTPRPDALRYCFRCPVIKQCANYGLHDPTPRTQACSAAWGFTIGSG
jgi:hypothetical protein